MASHRPSILQVTGLWQVQMDRDQVWKNPRGGRNPSPDFFMTYTADEVFAQHRSNMSNQRGFRQRWQLSIVTVSLRRIGRPELF